MFELQPRLKGEVLELRPLTPADWDALFAVSSDPLIWEQHPSNDRWQEPVFRKFFDDALATGGAFAVVDRQTGAMAGSTRYYGFDAEKSEIEIGWTFLARSHWGGKYNSEMKRLLLNHAFRFVERVIFYVGEKNMRSRMAMRKIGGVEECVMLVRGGTTPHVRFKIERSTYRA